MNLYLISQKENNDWDTYDSAVVVAESEDQARHVHPRGRLFDPSEKDEYYRWDYAFGCWASSPDKVDAKFVGVAAENLQAGYIVCASFNAG